MQVGLRQPEIACFVVQLESSLIVGTQILSALFVDFAQTDQSFLVGASCLFVAAYGFSCILLSSETVSMAIP